MSGLTKVGVAGVGSLGKEHARLYARMAKEGLIDFAGVYDIHAESAQRHAQLHGVRAFSSVEELAGCTEAVSVVTPTSTHFDVAMRLLREGRHVLVEKPMTTGRTEAGELVRLSQERGLILQVGHVGRFNPVFRYLEEVATDPRFIECHRLSPYPARSTDIGVVLDLMIHDLDVLLAFVRAPVRRIEAVGIAVLSSEEDIANARLEFENGCVANLTASRISPEKMRKIRVFCGGDRPSYVSLDYRAQEGFIYRLADAGQAESGLWQKLLAGKDATIVSEFAGRKIVREPVPITKEEPLRLELLHFIECVKARSTPAVTGVSAKAALEVAWEITGQIHARQARNPGSPPSTPHVG